jgi:tetratricopeptide (TPR) repeat protein
MKTHYSPIIVLLVVCAVNFCGCRSAKPPATRPATLEAADRTESQAEKYMQKQNWALAARMWQETANQRALLNDQPRLAIAWHNLAEADTHLDKLSESEDLLQRALEINERLGRTNEYWRNQIALLQVEALAQKTNELRARFEKLNAALPKDSYLQGLFLNELGLWQTSTGDYDKAGQSFHNAEVLFKNAQSTNGVAAVYANFGALKEQQRLFSEALEFWRAALNRFEALADSRGVTDALAGLGRAQLGIGKDLAGAEGYLRHAASNYETLKLPKLRAKTLKALAQSLAGQGKEKEAASARKQALELEK